MSIGSLTKGNPNWLFSVSHFTTLPYFVCYFVGESKNAITVFFWICNHFGCLIYSNQTENTLIELNSYWHFYFIACHLAFTIHSQFSFFYIYRSCLNRNIHTEESIPTFRMVQKWGVNDKANAMRITLIANANQSDFIF